MPTLTTPVAARVVAKERGLTLPAMPETPAAANDMPDRKQIAAERRKRQQIARDHLWPLLSAVFPEVFRLPAVPLAIGIHNQILEVAGDSIDAAELSAFLQYWTRRWGYLMAVWRGEPRHNLDGSVAGVPTTDQRNGAAKVLWGERAQPIAEPGHA